MVRKRAQIRPLAAAVSIALPIVLTAAAVCMTAIPSRLGSRIPPTGEMRAASTRIDLSGTAPTPPPPPVEPRTDRDRLVLAARRMLGTPYRWGAKGPDEYDCSGFTKAAYAAVGVRLPDGSFNQAAGERPLGSLDELAPGDLLFYRWNGAVGVSHVTMYLGDGWVIGTGSPATPGEVGIYPLAADFRVPDTTVTFRHIVLPDGS
ncbi:MAG: NlpC/P60 family protein [Anaerosomatales bacterium]|nr:NlpC/P60 family protein [Anaerosomatales bacterium]